MLFRDLTPTGLRGAILGFVEGALIVSVVLVGWIMLSGKPPDVPLLACLAVAGGLILALGRGISGRLLGVGAGCIIGVLVGLPLALAMPKSWDIEQSQPESTKSKASSTKMRVFDLAGPTLDGKTLDLADYRGKIVLVDFWATWCGPCIGELPNVRKTYDRYHEQGFEVIAVSLDTDRAALKDYVRKNGLPWPQVVFDKPEELGWNNPMAQKHGVKGIPATFLIDREGKVVAQDLRGGDLIAEVGRHIEAVAPVIPVRLYLAGGCGLLLGALAGALIQRSALAAPNP